MTAPNLKTTKSLLLPDFETFHNELQSKAFKSTKLAASLPSDIAFYCSTDAEFSRAIDACSGRVLRLVNQLLSLSASTQSASSSNSKGKAKLEDDDDVIDSFQSVVVDVLDTLLENADTCLDDHLGLSKSHGIVVKPLPQVSKSSKINKDNRNRHGRLDPEIFHASQLEKPQLKFKRKIDNSSSAWQPTLHHKYNAKIPLGYNFLPADVDVDMDMGTVTKTPHPYEYEIKNISYPQRLFQHADVIPPRSFMETPFTWVNTMEKLERMLDVLRSCEEIAVDLEHHSFRSFYGFLCLMQISTRKEDFIVDTLKLRDELEDLNEIFTDPNIVKVFHGADSDIIWLQQNFNLYIVNLFDTYQASKILDFPRHNLATLLTMYCDFEPDKRYQLADWRIRPLSDDMLQYARSDTHFLLHIFDNLRNALLDRGNGQPELIRSVLDLSAQTSLRTYEKQLYDAESGSGPSGWNTLAIKWNKSFTGLHMSVYRAVHAWRDETARREDESTGYVLPNRYLFQLAEQPPGDLPSLLTIFNPMPPLVRTRSKELLDVIRSSLKRYLSPIEIIRPALKDVDVGRHSSKIESTSTGISPSKNDDKSRLTLKDDNNSRLWSMNYTASEHPSSSTSSLLGGILSKPAVLYSCTRSTLFPSHLISKSDVEILIASRYREVLSRIHRSLGTAPVGTTMLVDTANISEADPGTTSLENANTSVPEQIEIPFVPASQRRPAKPEIDDTVVVIGQARQKKRKRLRSQISQDHTGPEGSSNGRENGREDLQLVEDEEPFDYNSVPNILDNNAQFNASGPIRKQRRKGPTVEYGNFPAPPRAYNEPKGANQSRTF